MWRQKAQQRCCMAVMCYRLCWGEGRGEGGIHLANPTGDPDRHWHTAVAVLQWRMHCQHFAQGVQYFRLMGKQFSDTSEITYSISNNTPTTQSGGGWHEGHASKRTQKPNRAILASYISTPLFLPAPQGTEAQLHSIKPEQWAPKHSYGSCILLPRVVNGFQKNLMSFMTVVLKHIVTLIADLFVRYRSSNYDLKLYLLHRDTQIIPVTV